MFCVSTTRLQEIKKIRSRSSDGTTLSCSTRQFLRTRTISKTGRLQTKLSQPKGDVEEKRVSVQDPGSKQEKKGNIHPGEQFQTLGSRQTTRRPDKPIDAIQEVSDVVDQKPVFSALCMAHVSQVASPLVQLSAWVVIGAEGRSKSSHEPGLSLDPLWK